MRLAAQCHWVPVNSDFRRQVAVPESDIAAIRAWAAAHPVVRRVWVFGRRARGTERPDSDIDVAVEHDAMPGDSDAFTTAICEAEAWRRELAPHLSAPLDLESYIPGITTTVQAGLNESSVLVYESAV
jgi:predicted nucleotidyltransferase